MSRFEVEWSAYGTATVEADDAAEAREIVLDAIVGLDASMLEALDVIGVDTDSVNHR
jgi:hypothetical protein